jgi:hypothetical protein
MQEKVGHFEKLVTEVFEPGHGMFSLQPECKVVISPHTAVRLLLY